MVAGATVPSCVSRYEEGDPECNGGPDSRPCAWRDRCAAFAEHLKRSGEEVEAHVKVVIRWAKDDDGNPILDSETGDRVVDEAYGRAKQGYEKFSKFCDELVSEYGVVEGKVGVGKKKTKPKKATKQRERKAKSSAPKPKPKPKPEPEPEPKPEPKSEPPSRKKTKPKPEPKTRKRPPYKRVIEKAKRMLELFWHFADELFKHFPKERIVSDGRRVAVPGQFYVIDRRKSGGYLGIYCRTTIGRDAPLARAILKPQSGTLDIQVPVKPDVLTASFGKFARGKLGKIYNVDDGGRFRSELRRLDKEHLALLAEYVFKLTDKGEIELPGV